MRQPTPRDVEPVEEHHGGRPLAAVDLGVGVHQEAGQARARVGNLHRLDARAADECSGGSEDLDRAPVHLHAGLAFRLQEALAGLVVARRAHEAGRHGQRMALLLLLAPARHDLVAHARPFREPCVVVADASAQHPADAMDLIDLHPDPRRARQADEQAHRPAVVVREVQERRIFLAIGHVVPLLPLSRAPEPRIANSE
jgi:hypothetical protein